MVAVQEQCIFFYRFQFSTSDDRCYLLSTSEQKVYLVVLFPGFSLSDYKSVDPTCEALIVMSDGAREPGTILALLQTESKGPKMGVYYH